MRKCLNCGSEIHPFDEGLIINDKERCWSCFSTKEFDNKPYFSQYIPNMVTGADKEYFTFTSIEELKEKLSKYLSEEFVLVKSDNKIMKQSLKKDTWYVLGSVENTEMKDIQLPIFNMRIYNKNRKN